MLKRSCYALAWATARLCHYLLSYTVYLIARIEPLKYIFERPVLIEKISKWKMLLIEFSINYVTQKAIKGQAIAD